MPTSQAAPNVTALNAVTALSNPNGLLIHLQCVSCFRTGERPSHYLQCPVVHNLQPSTLYSFVEAACTTAGCQTGGVANVTTLDSAPVGQAPPSSSIPLPLPCPSNGMLPSNPTMSSLPTPCTIESPSLSPSQRCGHLLRCCRWIQQYQNLQRWSVAHCELQNSSVMLSLYVGASVVQSPPVGSNLCDGQGHVVLFEQASNTFYVTVDTVHTAAITAAIVPLLTMKHVSYPLLNGTSVQVEVAASQFVRFETSLTDNGLNPFSEYLYSVTSLNSAGSADSSWSLTQEGVLPSQSRGGGGLSSPAGGPQTMIFNVQAGPQMTLQTVVTAASTVGGQGVGPPATISTLEFVPIGVQSPVPNGATVVYSGANLQATVTGLSPATLYFFSLVAYNAGGSTQSNASSVTTIESSPDGVPFPNVTIINATALAIVWSTPLVPNGIVTGYVVLQTNIPSGFSYVSTDLQPFTAYSCSILACTHWMDLMLCRCRILYCNGALAGVLPLTVISYNTTGLLPFTLYMYIYMSSSHARRHCTPVGTWCWASSVLQPACPDPPVHCDSNLLSMRRTALLGDPLILSRTLMTLSSAYLLIRSLTLTSPLAPRTPCILLLQLSSLLVEHTAPNIHDSNKSVLFYVGLGPDGYHKTHKGSPRCTLPSLDWQIVWQIHVHVHEDWISKDNLPYGGAYSHSPIPQLEQDVVAPGHKEHEEPLAVSIPSHHWMENYSSLGSKFRSRLGGDDAFNNMRTGGPLVSLTVPFGGQHSFRQEHAD
ncbi:hypothetical protein EMCRGX_G022028 [Ephydatia muelleri]